MTAHGPGGRRLRIGIDAHAIGRRQTGNERFTSNLIRGLRAICDHELFLYVGKAEAAAEWTGDERIRVRVLRPDHAVPRLVWHLPAASWRDRLDALLVQYLAPPVVRCPVVAVVHDVSFAVYPGNFSRAERAWMPRAIPASMRRAGAVVTVSAFSRDEIVRRYEIPPSRIAVAPNAVDPAFRRQEAPDPPVPPPFFLAIGNLQPRKNLETLIRAYRDVLRRRPDLPERLVIVGQARHGAEAALRGSADLVREGRVVLTGYLADDAVRALLRRATALAFPSLYEGFGLPVIEAMAAGVPVVASDIPVMREVAGDAALRVPPLEVGGWVDALERVALDPALRASLAERGLRRSERFTPEASAGPALEALERVAGATTRTR